MTGHEVQWTSVESLLCDLLRIDSYPDLVTSLLKRSQLDGGRFEATRFGRGQHSSATAGAILNGLGTSRAVDRAEGLRIAEACFGLLQSDGVLRGHDESPNEGSTSWAISQVLLGLTKFPEAGFIRRPAFFAAFTRLLRLRRPGTGMWLLREGDDFSDPVFAVYPTLLCLELAKDHDHGQASRAAVRETAIWASASLQDGDAHPLDRLLLVGLVERIAWSNLGVAADSVEDVKLELIGRMNSGAAFGIESKTIHSDDQPRWHSTTWNLAVYPFVRHWGGPTTLHNMRLVLGLQRAFDPELGGWSGSYFHGTAPTAWASSLAIKGLELVGRDVISLGLPPSDYLERLSDLQMNEDFDVSISFGGPDRPVAQRVRDRLVRSGLRVFFDEDRQHELLGEDLAVLLQQVYFERSRFAVAILSPAFLESTWAGNWEWRAILARMNQQKQGYLLPYFLDRGISVPGLNPTIGYISADKFTPEAFADLVVKKVQGV